MTSLPAGFSDEHQRAILKYLVEGRHALSSAEWETALAGFDMLHRAVVETETEDFTFDTLIDDFIERETEDTGELSAPLFYETLETIFEEPAEATTVELQARVVGSQLQLASPGSTLPGVEVHDNEIVVNNIRFVIDLKPAEMA